MSDMRTLPALFVAHGSPMLAVEHNAYTDFLHTLGQELGKPRAVVIWSAHWEAGTQEVSAAQHYETIHDFGGFPRALYEQQYNAPGDPGLANDIAEMLQRNGWSVSLDARRGLDHGAWVVLKMLYPEVDVPVVEMSVDPGSSPQHLYNVGKALGALRERGVLLVGSGGTVHNFAGMGPDDGSVSDWALAFDEWLEARLLDWDPEAVMQYRQVAPHADEAVPIHGVEHFSPLFYAMGAADDTPRAKLLHRSYRYGSLSHSVWQFG